MNRNPYLIVDDPTTHIGTLSEPTVAHVNSVLFAPECDDGRSEFLWLTLANGELALVVFPQGELYERLRDEGAGL